MPPSPSLRKYGVPTNAKILIGYGERGRERIRKYNDGKDVYGTFVLDEKGIECLQADEKSQPITVWQFVRDVLETTSKKERQEKEKERAEKKKEQEENEENHENEDNEGEDKEEEEEEEEEKDKGRENREEKKKEENSGTKKTSGFHLWKYLSWNGIQLEKVKKEQDNKEKEKDKEEKNDEQKEKEAFETKVAEKGAKDKVLIVSTTEEKGANALFRKSPASSQKIALEKQIVVDKTDTKKRKSPPKPDMFCSKKNEKDVEREEDEENNEKRRKTDNYDEKEENEEEENGNVDEKERERSHKLSKNDRYALFNAYFGGSSQEGICLCCEETEIYLTSSAWEAGHICAKTLGGVRNLYNRVPLCKDCNNNDKNTQNQLDYLVNNRLGNWFKNIVTIVLVSRQLYLKDANVEDKLSHEFLTCFATYAKHVFGYRKDTNKGGTQDIRIFRHLRNYNSIYFRKDDAVKGYSVSEKAREETAVPYNTAVKEHVNATLRLKDAENAEEEFFAWIDF